MARRHPHPDFTPAQLDVIRARLAEAFLALTTAAEKVRVARREEEAALAVERGLVIRQLHATGLSWSEIGALLGRDKSTLAVAARYANRPGAPAPRPLAAWLTEEGAPNG